MVNAQLFLSKSLPLAGASLNISTSRDVVNSTITVANTIMSGNTTEKHSDIKRHDHGFTLSNGTRIAHQAGAITKTPFTDLGFPVDMHELTANKSTTLDPATQRSISFAGQLGLIDFDTSVRLPRHVHIAPPDEKDTSKQRFVAERILVVNGFAMTELNGEIYVIPPRTLVTIAPGVPHTWTACPAGVSPASAFPEYDADMLQDMDRHVSEGKFLMVYEYEEETGFFPTAQTSTLTSVEEYKRANETELEELRFPSLSAPEVLERGWIVWGQECRKIIKPEEAVINDSCERPQKRQRNS